jgi:hypothetical protein
VKEIEQPKYPQVMKLLDLPWTVTFAPAAAGTGRRDGKPSYTITEGQRKLLFKIFEHQAIQKFYGVDNKDAAKDAFKKRVGVAHIADLTKEGVSKSIDAMVAEIRKTDPKFNEGWGNSPPGG